jgi:hypothetical protein
LEDYARYGLRTMVVSVRSVGEQEYSDWAAEMKKARVALQKRDVSARIEEAVLGHQTY